jgi:hypothetical protein
MRENFNSNALTIKFLQQTRNFVYRQLKKGKFAQLLAPQKFHGLQYVREYCYSIFRRCACLICVHFMDKYL